MLVGERAAVVDPQRYSDLQLGYAVTTHKAQGATVEVAASLVGEAVDRRQLYVQASRSRGATRLYSGERAEDLRRKCRLQREKLVATPLVRR